MNNKFIYEYFYNNFIINYEIKDDTIIVYYTKGKSIKIKHTLFPYTKENEINILNCMKQQFEKSNLVFNETSEIKQTKVNIYSDSTVAVVNLLLALLLYKIKGNPVCSITFVILYTPRVLYNKAKLSLFSKKINNDEKGKLFLKNEELINENIKKKMIELGLTLKDTLVPTPNCNIKANINDINELTEEEIENLIKGNIKEYTLHKLYKPNRN